MKRLLAYLLIVLGFTFSIQSKSYAPIIVDANSQSNLRGIDLSFCKKSNENLYAVLTENLYKECTLEGANQISYQQFRNEANWVNFLCYNQNTGTILTRRLGCVMGLGHTEIDYLNGKFVYYKTDQTVKNEPKQTQSINVKEKLVNLKVSGKTDERFLCIKQGDYVTTNFALFKFYHDIADEYKQNCKFRIYENIDKRWWRLFHDVPTIEKDKFYKIVEMT